MIEESNADLLREAQEQAARAQHDLHRIGSALAAVSVTTESWDRTMAVTLDAGGAITELDIRTEDYRDLSRYELSAAITTLIASARADLDTAIQAAMTPGADHDGRSPGSAGPVGITPGRPLSAGIFEDVIRSLDELMPAHRRKG